MDKNYKEERKQDMLNNEYETATDSDKESIDPLYNNDPIYSEKKKYIEEIFISEEDLIKTLKIIFEEI